MKKSKIIKTINISTIVIFLFITFSALFVLDIPKAQAVSITRDSSPMQNKYKYLPWSSYPCRCPTNDEPWVLDNGQVPGNLKNVNYDGNYFYECGEHTSSNPIPEKRHCTPRLGGQGDGHGTWVPQNLYGDWTSPGVFSTSTWPLGPSEVKAEKVSQKVYGNENTTTNILWAPNRNKGPFKTLDGGYKAWSADTTLFRNEFNLSEDDYNNINNVIFYGISDDWLKVYINRKELAESSWTVTPINNISVPKSYFQAGWNVIAIQASNKGYWAKNEPGAYDRVGLYYKLTINLLPGPSANNYGLKVRSSPFNPVPISSPTGDSGNTNYMIWRPSPFTSVLVAPEVAIKPTNGHLYKFTEWTVTDYSEGVNTWGIDPEDPRRITVNVNHIWEDHPITVYANYEPHKSQLEVRVEPPELQGGPVSIDADPGAYKGTPNYIRERLNNQIIATLDAPDEVVYAGSTYAFSHWSGDGGGSWAVDPVDKTKFKVETDLTRDKPTIATVHYTPTTPTLVIIKEQSISTEENTWNFKIFDSNGLLITTRNITIAAGSESGIAPPIGSLTPGQYTIEETGISPGTLDDWNTDPPSKKRIIDVQTGLNLTKFTNTKKDTPGSSWWPIWREVAP